MPIDFPNSPTLNQEYTVNGVTWKWNGTVWDVVSGGSGFRVSNTAPPSPALGDLWYESDSGEMFIYYDSQWVSPAVLASVGTSAIGTQQLASSAVTSEKALTSAASTITGTNSSGTSNALARADHNHTIKAPGVFYVYRDSGQTITQNTWTTVEFDKQLFDPDDWWNNTSSTSPRAAWSYTPQLAGYYRIQARIGWPDGANQYYLLVRKNGSEYSYLDAKRSDGGSNGGRTTHGSTIVYFNGTTDNISFAVLHTAGGPMALGGGWISTVQSTCYATGEYIGS